MSDAAIAAIAVRQHGLVTLEQARDAGLGEWAIRHRIATGRWVPVRRGVFAIGGAPPGERQAVLAACLAGGAVAARLTAARLWGLDLPAPDLLELLGPRRRLEGVRSHQSRTIVPADLAQLGAIPLTSPARTLVDCSGRVPPHRLGPVVDDALRRGLVRLADLRACHERADTGPGRRHTIALREVLAERAPGYAAGDSQREADIVRLLAASDLPAPVLGHRVRIGRHTYKLDIAWPEAMACIEFDGWATHGTFSAFHRDRQRLRRIVAAGWAVIPATAETDLHELVGDVTRLVTCRLTAA